VTERQSDFGSAGSASHQPAVHNPHRLSNAETGRAVEDEAMHPPILRAHVDVIFALGLDVLFHFVAGLRPARCADYSGGRIAAAAADLVAQQTAHDRAAHGADAGARALLFHHVDAVDTATLPADARRRLRRTTIARQLIVSLGGVPALLATFAR
jgi:hypothetical protein